MGNRCRAPIILSIMGNDASKQICCDVTLLKSCRTMVPNPSHHDCSNDYSQGSSCNECLQIYNALAVIKLSSLLKPWPRHLRFEGQRWDQRSLICAPSQKMCLTYRYCDTYIAEMSQTNYDIMTEPPNMTSSLLSLYVAQVESQKLSETVSHQAPRRSERLRQTGPQAKRPNCFEVIRLLAGDNHSDMVKSGFSML